MHLFLEFSEEYSKMTIAISLGAISFTILSCFGCFLGYRRLSKKRDGKFLARNIDLI